MLVPFVLLKLKERTKVKFKMDIKTNKKVDIKPSENPESNKKLANTIKFGEFIKIPQVMFRYVGISLFGSDGMQIKTTPLFYISFICLFSYLFCEIICLVFMIRKGRIKFIEISALCYCIVGLAVASYVFFKLYASRRELAAIMTKLIKYFPTTPEEQCEYETRKWTDGTISIMKAFTVVQVVSVQCYSLFPIVDIIVTFWKERRWQIDFPVPIWYPFDSHRRGIFELCYLHQVAGCVLTVLVILAFDLLVCVFTEQIRMHFKRLMRAFRDLSSSKNDMKTKFLMAKHVTDYNIFDE